MTTPTYKQRKVCYIWSCLNKGHRCSFGTSYALTVKSEGTAEKRHRVYREINAESAFCDVLIYGSSGTSGAQNAVRSS